MQRFIKVTRTDDKITLTSPYQDGFSAEARALGGSWRAADKTWTFAALDADRVAKLCDRWFDDDGRPTAEIVELVTVELRATKLPGQAFEVCGVEVFKRWSRDTAVKVQHAIVTEGGFDSYGGSRKNPTLDVDGSVTFELRDLPAHVGESVLRRFENHQSITARITSRRPRCEAAPAPQSLDAAPAHVAQRDRRAAPVVKYEIKAPNAVEALRVMMRGAIEAGAGLAELEMLIHEEMFTLREAAGLAHFEAQRAGSSAAPVEPVAEEGAAPVKAGGSRRKAAPAATQQEMFAPVRGPQIAMF